MIGQRFWLARGIESLSLVAVLAGVGSAAAQPADKPAQPTAPPVNGPAQLPVADAPSVQPTADRPTAKLPPKASDVAQRLDDALAPQPGGLRAADVAQKAEMTSPEVRAKQQAVAAAAAKVDQAALMFIPQFKLLARYVRLSDVGEATLGEGSLVGTNIPEGQPIPVVCPDPSSNQNCVAFARAFKPSFPVVLNIYTLQGTIQLPLSDYLLRISQNHASASRSRSAAEFQVKASKIKAQLDAKIAYYNWIRAKGGVVVAEQGLATASAHLKDVKVAEQVGSASRADLLAVEAQVASTQLLVESGRNMEALAEEQLRVMMHDATNKPYAIGDDIDAYLAPAPRTALRNLYAEALRQRLERRVMAETVSSLRETRKVLSAGNYPRLDAFGNLYYQNPNTRIFPQEDKWSTSWDVGIQLSWTINDTFTSGAQVDELDAKIMEVEAQRAQLDDGIRLQVTQAYNALREAEVAKDTTERQLKAAQESHRVRRELFRAGRATSSELTDAETSMIKAMYDALNARIDIRVAHENLNHALGRDAVR